MASRGRKPNSPKVRDMQDGRLHVLEGGKGKGGGGGKKPPAPPSWLNSQDAKRAWNVLVPDLLRRKQYLNLFQFELGRYCNAFGDYCAYRRAAKKKGVVESTPNGMLTQSPYVIMANRASEIMLRIAADLGMNAVAQQRLEGLQLDLFESPMDGGGNGGLPGEGEQVRGFGRFRED